MLKKSCELKKQAYKLMDQNSALLNKLTTNNYDTVKKAIQNNNKIISELVDQYKKIKGYNY